MQLVFLILIVVSALLIVGGIIVLNLGRQNRRRRTAARKPDLGVAVVHDQHTISSALTDIHTTDTPQPEKEPMPSAHAFETALAMGPAILSAAEIQTENGRRAEATRVQPQEVLQLLQGAEALCSLCQAGVKLSNVKTAEKRAALLEEIQACIRIVDPAAVRASCMATFDDLYPSFSEGLLEQAPDLTEQDLRLCAFLALEQSNKELAALTRRSIRTIETATYHLRKKLNIPPDTKTVDFLKQFLA